MSYRLKEINSKYQNQPIILQNENGPCALLAIINVLILQDTAMTDFIQKHLEINNVSEEELLSKIGEMINPETPEELEELFRVLPLLSQGLDVNPRFNGTFEELPAVFTSLNIRLYHGWVLGNKELTELGAKGDEQADAFKNFSYDQFWEGEFTKPNILLRSFIESFNSQLTHSGLVQVINEIKEGDFAVLFWNNHFSTVTTKNGELFQLVTDIGFRKEKEIVWEKVNLSGAGVFVDGDFKPKIL